jgi:hypothetical protein
MGRALGSLRNTTGLLALLACVALPGQAAAQQRNYSMFPGGFQLHFSYNTLQGLPTQQGQLGGGFGLNPIGNPFAFGFSPYGFPPPLFQAARMSRQPASTSGSMLDGYTDPGFSWYDPTVGSSANSGFGTMSGSAPGALAPPFRVSPNFGSGFQSN